MWFSGELILKATKKVEGRIKSQEPRAKSQEPRTKSQEPRIKSKEIEGEEL